MLLTLFTVGVLFNSLTDRQIVRNLARPGYLVQYSEIDEDLKSVSKTIMCVYIRMLCVFTCVRVPHISENTNFCQLTWSFSCFGFL